MFFYDKINKNRHKINSAEEEILKYMMKEISNNKDLLIKQVAADNYISQNTIVRLCKKLGFNGYSQFKEAYIISKNKDNTEVAINSLDDDLLKTKKLINQDIIDSISQKIHSSNKIIILGVGLSRIVANEFNERLLMIGYNSKTFIDPHFMRYNCEKLTSNDLVFIISLSGETKTMLDMLNIASLNNAFTVSITGFSNNSLATMSDVQLYAYSSESRIKGLDVSSRFSFSYITNLLFTNCIQKYFI